MRKFDMEALIKKAGGSFKLTVLIQKRLVELKRSAKSNDANAHNLLDIVYQEILDDKISLVPEEHAVQAEEDFLDDYKNTQRQSELEFADDDDKRSADDD